MDDYSEGEDSIEDEVEDFHPEDEVSSEGSKGGGHPYSSDESEEDYAKPAKSIKSSKKTKSSRPKGTSVKKKKEVARSNKSRRSEYELVLETSQPVFEYWEGERRSSRNRAEGVQTKYKNDSDRSGGDSEGSLSDFDGSSSDDNDEVQEEDYEGPNSYSSNGRKRRKIVQNAGNPKVNKKKEKKAGVDISEDEASDGYSSEEPASFDDESSSDSDDSQGNGAAPHKRFKTEDDDYGDSGQRSLRRGSAKVDYAESPSNSEKEEDDEGRPVDSTDPSVPSVPSIEKILDFKTTPEGETLFLIKWNHRAHIHNTWNTLDSLQGFGGVKKVTNYMKQLDKQKDWRSAASKEQRENVDVAMEIHRETLNVYLQPDRIIGHRAEGEGDQYLVKWQQLPYADCTWEVPEDIPNCSLHIAKYDERNSIVVRGTPSPRPHFEPISNMGDWFHGELRDYQLDGVNWLIHNWCYQVNGILADEMGLGKTIQTIATLATLTKTFNCQGPFMVLVPLSTVGNWESEFARWTPWMNVVTYTGNSVSREMIRRHELYHSDGTFKINAVITTYELMIKDEAQLREIDWAYLAVDEGHRLKNNESTLYDVLLGLRTGGKLLLTGTPLQNSIKELWSLLHFLMPEKFGSLEEFSQDYGTLKEEEQINRLHVELKPHLLRRVKKDVLKSLPAKTERILRVEMTPMQKEYYRLVLGRNFRELNRGSKGTQNGLLNIVMELKKASNHPYLFDGAEDLHSKDPAEGLIRNSGKMILLDKLLTRLRETGHRVLIFSQMVRMLDIMSDYLYHKGWPFQRLDGGMSRDERQKGMESFNAKDSKDFCFLLSTRAGGLGINLTSADTVIIFDSDWNPQNDLQAEARAHRIGQKKVVNIYRFITKGTVDEQILQRAKNKMILEHLVIQRMGDSKESQAKNNDFNKEELAALLKFGAEDLFKEEENPERKKTVENIDIDEILARAETSTEDPAGHSANDSLLNSFKVADFSAPTDPDFWKKIIPENLQREEKKEDEWVNLAYLPRRRTNVKPDYKNGGNHAPTPLSEPAPVVSRRTSRRDKRDDYVEEEELNEEYIENLRPKRTKKKKGETEEKKEKGRNRKKEEKKEEKREEKKDKKDKTRELRTLIKSYNRFGDMERFTEILQDSKLAGDHQLLRQSMNDIVSQCKEAAILQGQSSHTKAQITYEGVQINARELYDRTEEMQHLSKLLRNQGDDVNGVKIPHIHNVREDHWTHKWSHRDDVSLLLGVHKYGIGNWKNIQDDKGLSLTRKISSHPNDNLPKANELDRRVDVLLKMIRSGEEERGEKGPNTGRDSSHHTSRDSSHHSSRDNSRDSSHHSRDTTSHETHDEGKKRKKEGHYDKNICKKVLEPVQKTLEDLKHMQTSKMADATKIKKTKEYLLSVGQCIELNRDKKAKEEHLWRYASNFVVYDGKTMRDIYLKLKPK
ncbi:chromodomain-helicase-DNA-binding protein 1-like [Planoprotostelium fungivorum]|uniref:Chromodomain-helicase-DNA-binding protein 1-like n=1 Tax=Planoprotostelium fungivorum TaxID=1890364 RepID=A0A2P6NUS9_9EUKA|nr:chromodomain-helicase-DNA-binding protein 1-like [Planoprotostelium fungivorum]